MIKLYLWFIVIVNTQKSLVFTTNKERNLSKTVQSVYFKRKLIFPVLNEMKLLVPHIVELLRGGESQPELSFMRRNHTESAFYVLYFDFNDRDFWDKMSSHTLNITSTYVSTVFRLTTKRYEMRELLHLCSEWLNFNDKLRSTLQHRWMSWNIAACVYQTFFIWL